MKRELVISTRNQKKFKEIKRLFKGSCAKVLSLKNFSNIPKIIEDRKTFRENAVKKALSVSRLTNRLVLADDSGLEVKALRGKPGVHSSRYAGLQKNDRLNNQKLLRMLRDRPSSKRTAQFKCAVAVADRDRLIKVVEEACKGRIGFKMRGSSGFGYDPVFIPRGYNKTFAQLGPRIKDRLSHRAKALKKARRLIEAHLSRVP